jgi:Nucleotide-sugar transporter
MKIGHVPIENTDYCSTERYHAWQKAQYLKVVFIDYSDGWCFSCSSKSEPTNNCTIVYCFHSHQWPSAAVQKNEHKDSRSKAIGLLSVFAACFTSGFGSVYFEKILKVSTCSIWIRNIQLGCFGILMSLFGVFVTDYSKVASKGFFQGYNNTVWIVVALQVCHRHSISTMFHFISSSRL